MPGESILIVEDDGILAAHLQDTLTGLGYQVLETVATGEEAVSLTAEIEPGLIIMDIELAGELNGIAAAEIIRSSSNVPIVYLTGYSQEPLLRKARTTAPSGYLIKPVPERELQATIEMALYRQVLDRKLRESEERFRTLVENIPGAVYRFEAAPPWNVVFLSAGVREIAGWSAREFMDGQVAWGDLVLAEDRAVVEEAVHTGLTAGTPLSVEYRIRRHGGDVRWVQQKGQCLVGQSGMTNCIDGVILDITERKQLEEERLAVERELQQARKLESLVTLAGGVAHDFNNILSAVCGNIEMALMKLPFDSESGSYMESSLAASHRAVKLTQLMLEFTGQARRTVKDVDLNRVISDNLHRIRPLVTGNIQLHLDLHPFPVTVPADPDQLRQVVMSLVENAVEAIENGEGRVSIDTGIRACDQRTLAASRIAEKPPEGMFATLEVADNGLGMDDETRSRLFEPFFSTKFFGRGLGMAAVQGIVKGHGGAITVNSRPGRGTSVVVLLPLSRTSEATHPNKVVENRGP